MFKKFINYMLNHYQSSDYILQQKSKIVLSMTTSLQIIIPLAVIIYTVTERINIIIFSSLLLLFIIIFIVQFLLKNGYYLTSAHLFLISLLLIVWGIIYLDDEKPVFSQIDTVVYILALLGVTPLVTLRKKKSILIYYLINIIIFYFFIYKVNLQFQLNQFLLIGYVIDVSVAMLLMSIVSYQVFKINKNALDKSLQDECAIAFQNEQLRKSKDELKISETKYRQLYENALIGMVTIRVSDRKIINANDEAYKILGYSNYKDEVKNITMSHFYKNPTEMNKILAELSIKKEIYNYEIEFKKRDGEFIWCAFSSKIYNDYDKLEAVFIDISQIKDAEKDIYKLTFYDSLTRLPNKKLLSKNIESEIKKFKRNKEYLFSVICVGIDKFKNINDIYGHVLGDKLLVDVANKLKKVFRDEDTISRFDGDKFFVLVSDITNSDNVVNIVRKLYQIFDASLIINNINIKVTISCGICIFPTDGESSDIIIKNCETALYNAKEKGRNQYYMFDAKLNEKLIERVKLEEELKLAIASDEIIVYYQPKYDNTGAIISMEALVRWNSKKHGLIPPAKFIPIAEKSNMIIELDNIVFYKTCEQIMKWHSEGLKKIPVSVNISPVHFNNKNMITKIANIIKETGVSTEYLELEIVETGIMNNEKEAIRLLNDIHVMGMKISIDDFGTGYSSLSKVKDLPLDTVKIDKIFVDNLPDDIKSVTIAKTIIDLAHNLGFKVVAEGIEKKEQLDLLKKLNCDFYQGYYFSKPLPVNEIVKLL